MLADDVACNPRNAFPGSVFSADTAHGALDLYGDNIEVDFRGYEVTVENFIRVLTGAHFPETDRITLTSLLREARSYNSSLKATFN